MIKGVIRSIPKGIAPGIKLCTLNPSPTICGEGGAMMCSIDLTDMRIAFERFTVVLKSLRPGAEVGCKR